MKRLLYIAPFLLLLGCSTKKNTVVTRAFHNVTSRYNGYYYSNLNIGEGVYKIEKNNKDNYERILPVYIYPTPDNAKSTYPEFDKAIKKSSLLIQRHAIKDKKGNEIPSAGKWIDNNWINIGIAHFYKREFFSAVEAFEYVIRTYTKSEDKFTAMIWLIKTYNEIGSVSSSEPIISLLKNERGLPQKIKNELPIVMADYYIRRGQYTEAMSRLMEATRNTNLLYGLPKRRRARFSFIIAQLAEQQHETRRAMQYYQRTIRLKPAYEMVFYSRIRLARLQDPKKGGVERTKKDLLKMTKEFKNSDYYDVIYYTLGNIEEKQGHRAVALDYYKKSVQKSTTNQNQKALSYLKLGEMNFENTSYQAAEAYYDSAVVTLPKDHPDYNSIVARKKTLETLVKHIRTISREDSLQHLARMSEKERDAFITALMDRMAKEEERQEQERQAALSNTNTPSPTQAMQMPGMGGAAATFYFYNPSTVAMGVADFTRKWGNRKLEDNWRRSNKAMVIEDEAEAGADTAKAGKKKALSTKTKEYYLKDIPLSDSLMRRSNARMLNAYYMLGTVYKEELHNSEKTIATFEEMNRRFPGNKYEVNAYYVLYRTYLSQKNQAKADFYKEKILGGYPDSQFALLIKNPEVAEELNAQQTEVEEFYTKTYNSYSAGKYSEAYADASKGIKQFGKNAYLPKFEFIRAMSAAKVKGVDTLVRDLNLLVAKYPESEVTPRAKEILDVINKQRNPPPAAAKTEQAQQDSFAVNMEGEHFILAVVPDDAALIDAFKMNIGTFNTIFYSDKSFNVTSNIFGRGTQMVLIKSFPNAADAVSYAENLSADPDVFKGAVKHDDIQIFAIASENLPILYASKNVEGYKAFYEKTYKPKKESQ